jgi:hypothetical protein
MGCNGTFFASAFSSSMVRTPGMIVGVMKDMKDGMYGGFTHGNGGSAMFYPQKEGFHPQKCWGLTSKHCDFTSISI